MYHVTLQLEGKFLWALLCGANQGARYWATFDDWDEYGRSVTVTERDGGETREVTLDDLCRGIAIAADKYPDGFALWARDKVGDMTSSDLFLQCAIFGETKYG